MFKRKKIIVACFVALFGVNEVLAASISTRVRVLESKVATQSKSVKQLKSDYQTQTKMVKTELSKIQSLEAKLDQLIESRVNKSKQEVLEDKRYAFP